MNLEDGNVEEDKDLRINQDNGNRKEHIQRLLDAQCKSRPRNGVKSSAQTPRKSTLAPCRIRYEQQLKNSVGTVMQNTNRRGE